MIDLLDHFAGEALPLAHRDEAAAPTDGKYDTVADRAYLYAAAMLRARDRHARQRQRENIRRTP